MLQNKIIAALGVEDVSIMKTVREFCDYSPLHPLAE